jgi:hypothetical protein
MSEAKFTLIPNYLKASSPEKLRALMLETNQRLNSFVKYQDISELSDGSFVCWYYEEINIEALLARVNNRPKKKA